MKTNTLIYFYILGGQEIFSKTEDEYSYVKNNPLYRTLDEEQTSYHLGHPGATLDEVLACYEPMPFDLEDYKKTLISHLDYISLERYKTLMPEYKTQNAQISISPSACSETVYSVEQSSEIITEANRLSKLLRDERYRVFGLIQSSISKDEVDSAFNSAIFKNIQ